jgi:hypothetical protein
VIAVGNLMQRAKARNQAAAILRADLHRSLSERLGVPHDMPAEQLADATAARAGIAPERLRHALTGPPPRDETELVALARSIQAVRQEVTSASANPRQPLSAASAGA